MRVATLEASLAAAARRVELWSNMHLPADQLADTLDQLAAFTDTGTSTGGLLLKGSPGTGKTMLAKKIAATSGAKLFEAGVTTLKRPHIGGSAEAVRELWKTMRASKPAVLFIDECDSIFPKRGSVHADSVNTGITNAFLTEWDSKESGIWVIGSTNRRDLLDDAILGTVALTKG